MKVQIYNKNYDLPTLAQCNHRYSKDVYCLCDTRWAYDSYVKTVKNWSFDGIYDSKWGQLICFTCPVCGDKFMFHARDFKSWEPFGFFDKYELK